MTRKKRRFEQLQAAAATTADAKDQPRYKDAFQDTVGSRLEDAGKRLEGQGRNILYAVAALVVILIAFGIFYTWNKRSETAAQTALGKAIETSQATVSASPPPAGSTEKTFKTEKERAEAAIAEFQAVSDRFGGSAGEKAKYFIAVNRLALDKPAGIAELESLAASNSETGKLSKFALAQAKASDGKADEAIALYQELVGMSDPIVSKDSVNIELARLFEKQGKNQQAADIYFEIANNAAQAKDAEGKPIPMSQTARDAKDKLEKLDPERAKQIQEPTPESPFGSAPIGE
jgi:predicted negative regulator of RcsB-dependent stress response